MTPHRPFDSQFPLAAELCRCFFSHNDIPFVLAKGETGLKLIPTVLDGLNKAVDTHILGGELWLRTLSCGGPCGSLCSVALSPFSTAEETSREAKESSGGRGARRGVTRNPRQQREARGNVRRGRISARKAEVNIGHGCQDGSGTGTHRLVVAGSMNGNHFNALSYFAEPFFRAWQAEIKHAKSRESEEEVVTSNGGAKTFSTEEALRMYWRTVIAGTAKNSAASSRIRVGGSSSTWIANGHPVLSSSSSSSPSSLSSSSFAPVANRGKTRRGWIVQHVPIPPG